MKKIFCTQCGKELILFDKEEEIIDGEKLTKHFFVCDDCNIDFDITTHENIGIEENERTKQNRENAFENLREVAYSEKVVTDLDIARDINADYNDLIDLRNRIHDGTDEDTELYEEDHITLDHVLDYLEEFMKLINISNIWREKDE